MRNLAMGKMAISRVRLERSQRGWSLNHLADLTGIAASDLSQLERGLKPLYPTWRQRISKAFGVCEEELFPRARRPRPRVA